MPNHKDPQSFTSHSTLNPNITKERAKALGYGQRQKIKKRHWLCGGIAILLGSWITHSTTASITESKPSTALAFSSATIGNSDESLNTADLNSENTISQWIDEPYELISDLDLNTSFLSSALPLTEPLNRRLHKVKRGDTLGRIFKQLDLDLAIPHSISQHPTGKQLVSLSSNSELEFGFDHNNQLKEIAYPVNNLQNLIVTFDDNQIIGAEVYDHPFKTITKSTSGVINSSLYDAAQKAGLSNGMIMEMVKIFGWDIDFVQDIRQGDHFRIVYSENQLSGKKLSDGHILAAEFTTQNRSYTAIRFEDEDGHASYFSPEGESMLGTFLRSPVEFSRISSRFGRRLHPISKKWKAHRGVDYAASTGTPIRATADGKVIHAGRKGGYGKTVILRHAGRFSTLYAHMNGYAKNIRSGARVKQGQIIGYVGSTGMSTGPHLHYEFRLDGVHRNPLTYKTPKASAVGPERMNEFKQVSEQQLAKLDAIQQPVQYAQNQQR